MKSYSAGILYPPGSIITADDSNDEQEQYREDRIRRFKDDEDCMVLVANPQTASEGISLHTVCHHAIYVDRNFNATEFMQSQDRIHRYGLDGAGNLICGPSGAGRDTTIEILECEDSVDQLIWRNLARKTEAMYDWLDDDSLNPALTILEPPFNVVEISEFFPPTD